MTVDTTAIRFRLLRSYGIGDGALNLDRALQAACQDVAALCAGYDMERQLKEMRHAACLEAQAEVKRLRSENVRLLKMYEPDVDRRPINAVGVPQESIRDAQRLRELD